MREVLAGKRKGHLQFELIIDPKTSASNKNQIQVGQINPLRDEGDSSFQNTNNVYSLGYNQVITVENQTLNSMAE